MAGQKTNQELFLEKELLSPYTYCLQVKDKQLSFKIAMAFNHWLRVPSEKLAPVWEMLNMLFVSCIMCDDVQDDTKFRGALPAAHCVYGIPHTINTSFHVLLLVLEKALNLCPEVEEHCARYVRIATTILPANPGVKQQYFALLYSLRVGQSVKFLALKACRVIVEEYLAAFRGQGIEIYWRDNCICPTEEQFRKMIEQKTGRLLMIAVRSIQLVSDNKTDYSKLVLLLGSYFQINDDYCNLNHQKVCSDSRFCEDITEGKFTLPIIHAMQTADGEQIRNILRQRTSDVNLKKHFLSLLEKAGSLQYTRDAMAELDREARAEVARHGGNPQLEAVLDQLLDWQK